MLRRLGRNGVGLAAIFGLSAMVAGPVQAQAPQMRMLDSLAKGSWTLHNRDDDRNRSICLRSGRELIQLEHGDRQCRQFVQDAGDSALAVQYNCGGNEYGRTTIRSESSKLVQIRTQGIRSGTPFSYSAEARYAGSC